MTNFEELLEKANQADAERLEAMRHAEEAYARWQAAYTKTEEAIAAARKGERTFVWFRVWRLNRLLQALERAQYAMEQAGEVHEAACAFAELKAELATAAIERAYAVRIGKLDRPTTFRLVQ